MKEKIKNEYAVKNGFDDWDDLLCNALPDFGRFAINEVMDIFVNQEVEKRIAGVMPTKNEIGNAAQLFDKQKRPLWKEAIWRAGANWAVDIIRSRLTQKTEGGGE